MNTSTSHVEHALLLPATRTRTASLWWDAWRRLRHNRLAVVSAAFILVLGLAAVFAPWIAPYSPYELHPRMAWDPPSAAYWFGNDLLGRDLLSRVIYGSRISLTIGLLVQALALCIGVPLGLASGHFGGLVDQIIMRIVEIVMSFPTLLLIIILMSLFTRSVFTVFIAIGLVAWAGLARLVRGEVLRLSSQPFIEAARSTGCSNLRVMFRHILPNCLGPIIVWATLGVPQAIMAEAGLSFIGIGLPPPTPSWGVEIMEGLSGVRSAPHASLFPALAIGATLLALSYLGDGLRDALDPGSFAHGK